MTCFRQEMTMMKKKRTTKYITSSELANLMGYTIPNVIRKETHKFIKDNIERLVYNSIRTIFLDKQQEDHKLIFGEI